MKCLAVRQPWAWLLVKGYKKIENRSRRSNYRGEFLIHASSVIKRSDYEAAEEVCRPLGIKLPPIDELVTGAILGSVELVDCVDSSRDPFFFGPYGYVVANAREAQKPIPFVGQLNFFETKLKLSSKNRFVSDK